MEKKLINKEWMFIKERENQYSSSLIEKGELVNLPHTYNQEEAKTGEEIFRGATWYQKKLDLNSTDIEKELYLEIGAASLQSVIYVNGEKAAVNKTGYSMFRVYLTPYIEEGENLIAIRVSNEKDNTVYPLAGDFTFFGGIYRDVFLIKVEKQHFHLTDHSRDGLTISTEKINENDYEFKTKIHLNNTEDKVKTATLRLAINDQEENVIHKWKKEVELAANSSLVLDERENIENPQEWQGVSNPYLHQLHAELLIDGKVVDERTISFGFREVIVTSDQGVFLNGEAIQLNGVSRHQDFGEHGTAITKEMMDLDMSLITEMGANTVRLSHYQHDDYFYELCDREGLLVWTEIPFNTIPTTTDSENTNAKEQLVSLIQQTRNHPSVFIYGIQNEITIAVENEHIYNLVKELNELAKELDPDRYTAQANIYSVDNESPIHRLTDLVGYNLYYGWYYGELDDLGERMDAFHKENPEIPVMISEFGSDANPQYQTYEPKVRDYTESYQLKLHENVIHTIDTRPYLLGGTVWNMFDFNSDGRDEGGKKGYNQKGLVTSDRKLKKDAFYLYKANWSKEPFVKIAESRFKKRHRKNNQFTILSNLPTFEVYLNNEKVMEVPSQGAKTILPDITLEEGINKLEIIGQDTDDQKYYDQASFEKVSQPAEEYVYQAADTGQHVVNWFEKFDLSDVSEATLDKNAYSTFDTIGDLMNNEQTADILQKYFGTMFESERFSDMKELATLESLAKLRNLNIPKELLTVMNKELNTVTKDPSLVKTEK